MKRIVRVAVFLLLVFILVACAPAANTGEGVDQPDAAAGEGAAADGDVVVTNESADQNFDLKVGDRVVVQLDDEHDWALISTPTLILGKAADATLPEGAQGVFEAKMPGNATIQATGKPNCLKDDPPCSEANLQFNIRFSIARE